MSFGWKDIAFTPDAALVEEVAKEWRWLLGDEDWSPVLCSRLGDMFIERPNGRIDWLSCSAGIVERAALNRAEFDEICRANGDQVDEWFGPSFVATLHAAGKIADEGQCYLFITLPIFAECRYEPDNIGVIPIREVFVGLSDVHRQIAELPDGQKVQVKVVD
jgi:hypothetical protein